jgi:glycine amidinotransferase
VPQGSVGVTSSFGAHHEWGKLQEVAIGTEPALGDLLRREGVTAHSEDIPKPRDPLIVIGHHFIEASMRLESRQLERFAMRPIVQKFAQRRGANWACVPPGWPNGVDGPYLEGGDVLLNGRQIYVGMSGQASDMAGIDWLEALLGPDYRVIPIAMRSSVPHLQDVLALVRPGLIICCPPLLIDGLPTALRGCDAIEISAEEAGRQVAQILVLDTGRAIVAASNVRVAEELRRRGIDTIPLAFDGGLRSAHQALWRDSVLE